MARPPAARGPQRNTRDRIVDAAITLFNASGIAAVTTNHVAMEAGVSPGNLYYHFADKEEIIREAFERANAEADAIWKAPSEAARSSTNDDDAPQAGEPPGVDSFHRMLLGNLELFTRYAFIARELPALLRADPLLRARYVEVTSGRMQELEALLRPFAASGIFRGLDDPEDLHALVETAWVLGLFCIPYSETVWSGEAASPKADKKRLEAAIARGAVLVLHLLRPYLDPLAYAALVVLVRSSLEK